MKSERKYITGAFLILLFYAQTCLAQWKSDELSIRFSIPEVAVIDIESTSASIAFSLVPSSEPGGKPELICEEEESVWINYTSSLRTGGQTRSINAQIEHGSLPEGISLFLQASPPSISGSVNQGFSNGKIQVNNNAKSIISGIGNCLTGDGLNRGHELQFSLEITDFSKIESIGSEQFTILYTITDN